jgi:adenosyl cobinamide kinase/adenosyl cobinamide phosphate guanylyltransferase
MNKKLIFSVLVVCLLAFVAVMAFSQTSQNVRWEYFMSTNSNIDELNRLGREGWELVTHTVAVMGNQMGEGLIYKRRLP